MTPEQAKQRIDEFTAHGLKDSKGGFLDVTNYEKAFEDLSGALLNIRLAAGENKAAGAALALVAAAVEKAIDRNTIHFKWTANGIEQINDSE